MKIKALPLCMAVVFMFSAEKSSGFVTDDPHNEHVHSTRALTKDEEDELLGGLEELQHLLKQIKMSIEEMSRQHRYMLKRVVGF